MGVDARWGVETARTHRNELSSSEIVSGYLGWVLGTENNIRSLSLLRERNNRFRPPGPRPSPSPKSWKFGNLERKSIRGYERGYKVRVENCDDPYPILAPLPLRPATGRPESEAVSGFRILKSRVLPVVLVLDLGSGISGVRDKNS